MPRLVPVPAPADTNGASTTARSEGASGSNRHHDLHRVLGEALADGRVTREEADAIASRLDSLTDVVREARRDIAAIQ